MLLWDNYQLHDCRENYKTDRALSVGDACRFIRTASPFRSSYRLLFAGSKKRVGEEESLGRGGGSPRVALVLCPSRGSDKSDFFFPEDQLSLYIFCKKTETFQSLVWNQATSPDSGGTSLNDHDDPGRAKIRNYFKFLLCQMPQPIWMAWPIILHLSAFRSAVWCI